MKIFEISLFWLHIAPTYYGLMYALWFMYGLWAIKKTRQYTSSQIDSLFLYIFIGVVLGGRLWYIFFYNFSTFISEPLSLFKVWEWWMSFHGWFLGVCFAIYLFARKHKVSLWGLADHIAKIVPVGIFLWRIGNYLNKELLGFSYSWPFAVHTSTWSYFPSPLVEAFLEWICIFILLNCFHKAYFPGRLSALFLLYYWIFRTLVELFIRTPDSHIGYYFAFLTQWSLLSIPMIIVWGILYFYLQRNAKI